MTAKSHEAAIRAFFDDYQKRMNDALADPPLVDVAGQRRAFSRYFVGSDPKHVRGGRNGLLFRLMIPRGYAFYRKIGTRRMEIRDLRITALDDFHATAHVHWWSAYRSKAGKDVEIAFDNIYLLHIPDGGDPQIFAYVTGDEQQALRDHGLI